MVDRASSAPASQLVFLFGLLLFEYMPTQKTVGTHTISHDIVVMRSECCAGVCTCLTAARTLKSSGATTLSASMETAGCIGAGGQRSSEGIELSGMCRVCRRRREPWLGACPSKTGVEGPHRSTGSSDAMLGTWCDEVTRRFPFVSQTVYGLYTVYKLRCSFLRAIVDPG